MGNRACDLQAARRIRARGCSTRFGRCTPRSVELVLTGRRESVRLWFPSKEAAGRWLAKG